MRTRKLPLWDLNHPRTKQLRDTCKTHNDTAYFMSFAERLTNEELCNLTVTLIHQTITMIGSLIELVKADFLKSGGIKEQMYRARVAARNS